MRPESGAYLWDATQASRLAREFSQTTTKSEFSEDLLVRSAVERQLEILGEALRRLRSSDPSTAERVEGLDRIVGMRNVIAHEYGEIDYEILWHVVTTSIPRLIPILEELVAEARDAAGL